MDVLHLSGSAPHGADVDMDMDMDIDLAPDPDIAALEAAADAERIDTDVTGVAADASMEGSPTSEKVHVRGLDSLATADVMRFVEENHEMGEFDRIEWIDDTSANIVYTSAEAASRALLALTLPQDIDPLTIPTLQLRPAKKLSTHPDTELQVRLAFSTDVKKPRAHEASRFYLMNPDKDPREMRRQRGGRRGGDFQRKRRQEDRDAPFDESMYDDDVGQPSPASLSDSAEDRRKRVRFDGRRGDDLFSSKMRSDGRLRNRSASPGKEGDGRHGFPEDDYSARSRPRRRSVTPPRSRAGDLLSDNSTVELFPNRSGQSGSSSSRLAAAVELFPNKTPPAKPAKELFPHKTSLSNHRRTDAFDAADETSPVPFNQSRGDSKPRDLFERIGRPASSFGRTSDSGGNEDAMDSVSQSQDDFSILGKAKEGGDGFSIRGAAQGAESDAPVRELFPNKLSNDLFAEKLQGRGGPRKRAQDLFS